MYLLRQLELEAGEVNVIFTSVPVRQRHMHFHLVFARAVCLCAAPIDMHPSSSVVPFNSYKLYLLIFVNGPLTEAKHAQHAQHSSTNIGTDSF